MRIIVNHLTRMQPPYICVAGIDVRTGTHIRPVLDGRRISSAWLHTAGRTIRVGAIVDIGQVTSCGHAPEWEDHRFAPHATRWIADVSAETFWQVLNSVAQPSLQAIFGPDLEPHDNGYIVNLNRGVSSLGCLRAVNRIQLQINNYGKIRAAWHDGARYLSLSVTDMRLHDDTYAPYPERVAAVARRLAAGEPAILAVGLSRQWQKPGDHVERHWLQVNNIFLEGDPFLELARDLAAAHLVHHQVRAQQVP